ncbi:MULTISPECIES: response regulator transcription factor [unclassified Oceanobacter]|uniref:response regulator transcription factor n=1 Tax=unclassified Oceanobacter TaxID=2620260 RepID=UPI0026E36CF5|nr:MULTISPECIES: response regulator transcription factor [unclassified Oceanobacter]MDO6682128.1 response regulator transcription factor [Oceanobacter sp. 5_MG-2023]MDP2505476.1 response regulator transcription factor [Oceanobacter sp. 3_MG-2023]MDP2548621.1 response regulator transcription factor [Oceanobacter sp. 4_MG-2023]MDP2610295.1 response regulator transcription factor [Oceanobacter sp. 1_MG-2023]MDP2613567.1 response regulator transcription factor [Oceanobacter sp. 2_MG-2023]
MFTYNFNSNSFSILIIDDHRMFAEAMVSLFSKHWPSATIRCVHSAEQGLEQVLASSWQLVLLDLGLPDSDGLKLLQQLRQQDTQVAVLVCTGESRGAVLTRVLNAGASGLITKNQSTDDILLAVRRVLQGERYLAPEVMAASTPHPADLLSERQLAILTLMQAGYATQQIAEQLFLSPNTVKTHIRLMFDKLGVNNRIECLRAAHQHGYL